MFPKKVSATPQRVIETLKLLYNAPVCGHDIINYFEKLDSKNRIYTNEVILKYINTFKVFGLRFIKEKDKYVMLNAPQSYDFNHVSLEAIALIELLIKNFPEERVKVEVGNFLQRLEQHFSDSTRAIAYNMKRRDFINFEFDYSKYSDKIREYEKYCIEGQRIKVFFEGKNGLDSLMIEPVEIKYAGKEVFLRGYNPVCAHIRDINFEAIKKVEQLPLRSSRVKFSYSVTFELKGRLAKAYRLHEGEEVFEVKPDGNILILSKKEDKELLLRRLLRYGELCEVVSPKSFREEMKERINKIIKNYS